MGQYIIEPFLNCIGNFALSEVYSGLAMRLKTSCATLLLSLLSSSLG